MAIWRLLITQTNTHSSQNLHRLIGNIFYEVKGTYDFLFHLAFQMKVVKSCSIDCRPTIRVGLLLRQLKLVLLSHIEQQMFSIFQLYHVQIKLPNVELCKERDSLNESVLDGGGNIFWHYKHFIWQSVWLL